MRRPLTVFGFLVFGLIIAVAAFGPMAAPYDPAALSPERLKPPSPIHVMGTENLGRDVFSRLLYGTRVSILVSVGAVLFGLVVGSLLGMLAGLRSGSAWDALGSVVFVPVFARVARASVLAEMREDYVLAARSFGAGSRDLLFGNLLPNIQAPLIVQAAFSLAIAIGLEAAVSFLGLGVQPPDSSWGTMLADARKYVILGAWWLVAFPSATVALAVLSANLLGDALRDALDPRESREASVG
ncbi:MAG: ABC transporter permease [Chloroflexi bacterium]|nr:ABC transporter permease [Chloroflexota bacterium]